MASGNKPQCITFELDNSGISERVQTKQIIWQKGPKRGGN